MDNFELIPPLAVRTAIMLEDTGASMRIGREPTFRK
jgi:hypothetical protein